MSEIKDNTIRSDNFEKNNNIGNIIKIAKDIIYCRDYF